MTLYKFLPSFSLLELSHSFSALRYLADTVSWFPPHPLFPLSFRFAHYYYKSGHRGRWNGTSWLPSWVSEKQLYISFNFFDQEALLIYVISLSLYHTYLYVQSCWHVQVTFASLGNRFIGSMKSGFLITAISEAIKVGRFCLPTSAFCTKQCFLNFCEKYGYLHTVNQK